MLHNFSYLYHETTTVSSYEAVLHYYKRILYLQICYAQILMFLIFRFCFYAGFVYVQQLPEDDQDRSKHVGVMKFCGQKNIILNLVDFFGFIV